MINGITEQVVKKHWPQSDILRAINRDLGASKVADSRVSPLSLAVDVRKGAGMPEYPHHPFQRASVSPTDGGPRVEETLLQAALALQQLASGTEDWSDWLLFGKR